MLRDLLSILQGVWRHWRDARKPTREAEQVLQLLAHLVEGGVTLQCAIRCLQGINFSRRMRKIIGHMNEDIEHGEDFLRTLEAHVDFGKFPPEFLRLTSRQLSLRESLVRYQALRTKERTRPLGARGTRVLTRESRLFAITFATCLQASGDLPGSIKCAALERPRGLRRRILRALPTIQAGECPGYCLPKRRWLHPGLDERLVRLLGLGMDASIPDHILGKCESM